MTSPMLCACAGSLVPCRAAQDTLHVNARRPLSGGIFLVRLLFTIPPHVTDSAASTSRPLRLDTVLVRTFGRGDISMGDLYNMQGWCVNMHE